MERWLRGIYVIGLLTYGCDLSKLYFYLSSLLESGHLTMVLQRAVGLLFNVVIWNTALFIEVASGWKCCSDGELGGRF